MLRVEGGRVETLMAIRRVIRNTGRDYCIQAHQSIIVSPSCLQSKDRTKPSFHFQPRGGDLMIEKDQRPRLKVLRKAVS